MTNRAPCCLVAVLLCLAASACVSTPYVFPKEYDFPELTIISPSTRFRVTYFAEAYQVDPQTIILQAANNRYLVILERPNIYSCTINIENFTRVGSSILFFSCQAGSVPIRIRRTYQFRDEAQMLEYRARLLRSQQ